MCAFSWSKHGRSQLALAYDKIIIKKVIRLPEKPQTGLRGYNKQQAIANWSKKIGPTKNHLRSLGKKWEIFTYFLAWFLLDFGLYRFILEQNLTWLRFDLILACFRLDFCLILAFIGSFWSKILNDFVLTWFWHDFGLFRKVYHRLNVGMTIHNSLLCFVLFSAFFSAFFCPFSAWTCKVYHIFNKGISFMALFRNFSDFFRPFFGLDWRFLFWPDFNTF